MIDIERSLVPQYVAMAIILLLTCFGTGALTTDIKYYLYKKENNRERITRRMERPMESENKINNKSGWQILLLKKLLFSFRGWTYMLKFNYFLIRGGGGVG
jgi:hypothetical protein